MISKKELYKITNLMLSGLYSEYANLSSGKAKLATLRKSIGKSYEKALIEASFLYEWIPEDFTANFGRVDPVEKVILTVAQLFSLHQQGKSDFVHDKDNEKHKKSFGKSLSLLRIEKSESVDKRFNSMITARTYNEFVYHLRQLLKILTSKHSNIKIAYDQLAIDLYDFEMYRNSRIKLQWSRDYYIITEGEKENE